MLHAPAVLAVVAKTCQRPFANTTDGSLTDTIGWVASCLAVISGAAEVHLNDAGRPVSNGGAPPLPVAGPWFGSFAQASPASASRPALTRRRVGRRTRLVVERDIARPALSHETEPRGSTFDTVGGVVAFLTVDLSFSARVTDYAWPRTCSRTRRRRSSPTSAR